MSALDVGFGGKAASSAESSASAGRRMLVYGVILVVLVIAFAVRSFVSLDAGVTFTEAPPETQGSWTTDDPRYVGRAIEVGPITITLRRGEDGGEVPGRLVIGRELFENGVRVVRLEYESPSGPDALDMVVEPDGTMYLKNQPSIEWAREGGVAVVPPPAVVPPDRTNGLGAGALGGLLAIVVLTGAGMLWLFGSRTGGGESAGPGGAPNSIRGVWTTPDPKFEGQSIRIAHGYSFAQFGPGDVRIGGVINSVSQRREDGDRIVTVTYRTREGMKDLEMIIDRSGHMRLHGGPRSVWVRRDA